MTIDDVLAKTKLKGFSGLDSIEVLSDNVLTDDAQKIKEAIKTIYNGSPTAREMINDWLAGQGHDQRYRSRILFQHKVRDSSCHAVPA